MEKQEPIILQDKPAGCRGEFHLEVRKAGQVIETYDDHNLVVYAGRQRLAELACGLSSNYIAYIGIGTGTTDETDDDTALENQLLFPLKEATVTDRVARLDFLIGEDDANGMEITEFGLFCSDETMFSHRLRRKKSDATTVSAIEKADDIQITGHWLLHF